jgi:hypothetical protein
MSPLFTRASTMDGDQSLVFHTPQVTRALEGPQEAADLDRLHSSGEYTISLIHSGCRGICLNIPGRYLIVESLSP